MINFAIEAARRGCPYVSTEENREDVNFWRGDECHFVCRVNNASQYDRFIIGATLALWWTERSENRFDLEGEPHIEGAFADKMAEEAKAYAVMEEER